MQCTCAILSTVVGPALQYFSTFSHNRQDFRKQVSWYKFVFWFPLHLSSEIFLILRSIERDTIKKHSGGLHVKYPSFLSDFNERWSFSTVFRKLLRYKISWKCVQLEPSCSMRTDGRTDMAKLIVAFCKFAKAPKILNFPVGYLTGVMLV